MGRATAHFGSVPFGPREESKGQITLNFNYKVNFKDFFTPNVVCDLTNEIYKTYQTGFSFCRLGHRAVAAYLKAWSGGRNHRGPMA